MVYKPAIPQPTDFIAQSQKDMIGNFETVNELWGKEPTEDENIGDHVPLIDGNDDDLGAHKKTTLVQQSSEPVPKTNEIDLFTQDNAGVTEVYYKRDGDAAGNQITSLGGPVVGGLVLRAFVVFDFQGNIIEREELDEEGETIKVPLSFNVASVVPQQALQQGRNIFGDWLITYTKNLPTADYIWDYRAFIDVNFNITSATTVQAQPFSSATYASSVTAGSFRAWSTNIARDGTQITPAGPVIGRLDRMIFQAFTVV